MSTNNGNGTTKREARLAKFVGGKLTPKEITELNQYIRSEISSELGALGDGLYAARGILSISERPVLDCTLTAIAKRMTQLDNPV